MQHDVKNMQEEETKLNQPITTKFLLTFTIPTILSMVIMGVFGTVDGIFASRGISHEALAAVNFVAPFFAVTMAIGMMLSMGGCALVAKRKGEGKHQQARENFTFLTLVTFISSCVISLGSWVFRTPLLQLLGTDEHVMDIAMDYLIPLIVVMPFVLIGVFVVQFMIAEGQPMLGMVMSISGSVISAILNAIFIFLLELGVPGLAWATGIGWMVPTLLGLGYFTLARKGTLYFVKPKWETFALWRSSLNGISEMITAAAFTVTTIVMNNVLVRLVGWEGVAAAGIVMAAQGVLSSLFFGYAAGVAPVVSYNYGKQDRERLNLLFRKSLGIVVVLSVIALVGTWIFADPLVRIYVSPNDPFMGHLHAMAMRGLRIAALSFIVMGFNTFATSWFTAFNDGLVSGLMSVMRTMVFALILLVTLPRVWDLDGVWVALPLSEVLAIALTVFFLWKLGDKYMYRAKKRLN